jgi:hypothetical protein
VVIGEHYQYYCENSQVRLHFDNKSCSQKYIFSCLFQGFRRKEFRGKLAIAITANFINRHTEAEARVEEISGVAFIFNQKFFKDLYEASGIDLENIVYYKDETHYFVMTAKKHSLIDKGVILQVIRTIFPILFCSHVINIFSFTEFIT